MDYSLRVNQKKVATDSSPDRNLQFDYIPDLRQRFRPHLRIISVDTKKRELVGNFKNNGTRWDLDAWPVHDHDFRSDAIGHPLWDLPAPRQPRFGCRRYFSRHLRFCRSRYRALVAT